MANEIWTTYEEGNTLYALIWRGSDDKVWNNTDSQFDTYTDADILKYDVPLANQVDSDYYSVDFPAAITDTATQPYRVQVMLQIGGSPDADADVGIAQAELFWNGNKEISIGTISISNNTVVNNYEEGQPTPNLVVINL